MLHRMGDSFEDDVLQEFTLVEFIHRGRKRKVEQIDVVPSSWLLHGKQNNQAVTKFHPSPIEGEDIDLLHDIVKSKSEPPENWPYLSVKLVGRASKLMHI